MEAILELRAQSGQFPGGGEESARSSEQAIKALAIVDGAQVANVKREEPLSVFPNVIVAKPQGRAFGRDLRTQPRRRMPPLEAFRDHEIECSVIGAGEIDVADVGAQASRSPLACR